MELNPILKILFQFKYKIFTVPNAAPILVFPKRICLLKCLGFYLEEYLSLEQVILFTFSLYIYIFKRYVTFFQKLYCSVLLHFSIRLLQLSFSLICFFWGGHYIINNLVSLLFLIFKFMTFLSLLYL